MGNVVLEITMSLDGIVAGPNVSADHPLGEGGQRLHDWLFRADSDRTTAEAELLAEHVTSTGAVVVGRRTYDTALEKGWDGVTPFAAPAFLVSNDVPKQVIDGFTVVTDGIEQAKAVAGDRNVWVMGGAGIAQQSLRAGLVDELRIHIAAVLFGTGTRLFDHIGNERIELEQTEVRDTPGATHLSYRVVK